MATTGLRARQTALQALFEADITAHAALASLERLLVEERLSAPAAALARRLVEGVCRWRADLDQTIQAAAPLWPLDQVAAIDRNVLRLAAYELMIDGSQPAAIIINDAVELAKRFGSESSARFVNGVLGTLARSAPQHQASIATLSER